MRLTLTLAALTFVAGLITSTTFPAAQEPATGGATIAFGTFKGPGGGPPAPGPPGAIALGHPPEKEPPPPGIAVSQT
jgi:hypothetical protein